MPKHHPGQRGPRRRARLTLAVLAPVLVLVLASCEQYNSIARPEEPFVLTGADLPGLVGTAPSRIVAFAHTRPNNVPTWTQIPVQVDERKVVDYGSAPANNTALGATGTVYGTSPIGVTGLQYADAGTFVGADPNAAFDADDELVFMVGDGGGLHRDGPAPAGVVAGSGVQVQLTDPVDGDKLGWVYLFESDGSLVPSAGRDYVTYQFKLTSGAYKTSYKRADGPNPETSIVTTANYQARMTDRWNDADWRITTGGATGVDVLDGLKNQFALTTCVRSNVTFQDEEGAFVANIDGPVRAIRSYVGANSGPLAQRTNIFYRSRQQIITNLRVHAIPSILDYLDYSSLAIGMTYSSSEVPGGVTIDGTQDAVGTTLPTWELIKGQQGSIITSSRTFTSIAEFSDLNAVADALYLDRTTPANPECWGDGKLLGASGVTLDPPDPMQIPNTDPRQGGAATLTTSRLVSYGAPTVGTADAAREAARVDNPLHATVSAYAP